MRIPKRFKLLGKQITVHDDPRLDFRDGATGMSYYASGRIGLQTSSDEHPVSDLQREQIFCHELTHHILHAMEKHKLGGNEKFVNLFGSLLHQALITMEYEY